MNLCGYYAILDIAPSEGASPTGWALALERAQRLLQAGPCMLQIRAKGRTAAELAAVATGALPLARAAGVPLCVNDRLDVALSVGADAVHLGQDDLPLSDARNVARGRILIGVSTHNAAQARAAVAGGADYIGFGPVFGTSTKERPDPVVGLDALRQVAREIATATPVVGIGGITLARVGDVAAAGASAAALIAAIDSAADPVAVGRAVSEAFMRGRRVD